MTWAPFCKQFPGPQARNSRLRFPLFLRVLRFSSLYVWIIERSAKNYAWQRREKKKEVIFANCATLSECQPCRERTNFRSRRVERGENFFPHCLRVIFLCLWALGRVVSETMCRRTSINFFAPTCDRLPCSRFLSGGIIPFSPGFTYTACYLL
jgi:hypothetical protein